MRHFEDLSVSPSHSRSALHYNIPLWYSSPHSSLETITATHPRLAIQRKSSELVPNSWSTLSVSCKDWDYSQHVQTECLRLSVGVTVTPESVHVPLHPSTIHPRPGPLSPPAAGDVDASRTKKRIVSYTAVVPAGQDPNLVFIGWTTAQFRYIASQFQSYSRNGDTASVGGDGCRYGQRLELVGRPRSSDSHSGGMEYKYSSAFVVCLKQLLANYTEQHLATPVRWVSCVCAWVHVWGCVCGCVCVCIHAIVCVCVFMCVHYLSEENNSLSCKYVYMYMSLLVVC